MNNSQQEKNAKNIERRSFVKAISLSSASALLLGTSASASASDSEDVQKGNEKKKLLMKLGCQSGGVHYCYLLFCYFAL